ncbi:hypothetical protein ACFQ36_11135 [Arthrobacter sp. GCM10027362]|uniref:hypothetical protein n=1 Tax=Arthrobacter sp. GCM10027362 TaxID=3273379 RepID=UPI003627F6B6
MSTAWQPGLSVFTARVHDSETDTIADRRTTAWPVFDFIDPELPQEIVTLTPVRTRDGFEATAARSWVSDIDGTGLEAD